MVYAYRFCDLPNRCGMSAHKMKTAGVVIFADTRHKSVTIATSLERDGSFLLSYSDFLFSFSLFFFVSVPCARLSWPSRQLLTLSERKSTVCPYRIVSYRITNFIYWHTMEWIIRPSSSILHDELHWLDVPQRVTCKLCVTVYCLHGLAPQYLSELCVPVADVAGRRQLRSVSRGLLYFPRYNMSNYSRRAFSYTGLHA